MKIKLICITLSLCLSINLFAFELDDFMAIEPNTSPYKNLRESRSILISSHKEQEIRRLYEGSHDLEVLKNLIVDKSINRCASKLTDKIKTELNLHSKNKLELAILGLRLDESIDDIAAGILIAATDKDYIAHPLSRNELTNEEEKIAIEIFKKKISDIKNKSLCPEDTFRSLVNLLARESFKLKKNLKDINKIALKQRLIKEEEYNLLERMRVNKVHEWPFTLGDYATNLQALAKAFPNRTKESSPTVTDGVKFRSKKSLRLNLHSKFNSTQIILLANIVKGLRKRLDSKDIVIHINYDDQETEIINLSPMEKFRFILKLLRKELALLNNSSLLGGQKANYIDIITAAYEVGYISASEIEQLAGLEDIWNPKKTTKEKIMVWVKFFGGTATTLLPPPFGFLSVMVIMLIDQQISEAPVDPDTEFSII